MTPREIDALRWQWAQHQALQANLVGATADNLPFSPEDFMDPTARTQRLLRAKRDRLAVARENRRLEMMRPDDADIPEWAKPGGQN